MWPDLDIVQTSIICIAVGFIIGMPFGSVVTAAVARFIENYTIEHLKQANKLLYKEVTQLRAKMRTAIIINTDTTDKESDEAGDDGEEEYA